MSVKGISGMKRGCLLAVLSLLPLVLTAQAPDERSQGDTATTTQMQQMQSHMETMREQMARIHAATGPGERQRLMGEHMRTMHEGMKTMGRTMQAPMAQGQTRQCAQEDAECRMDEMQMQQQMMGQRMGMMQQMMEQMMERMMQAQKPEAPAPAAESEDHGSHH